MAKKERWKRPFDYGGIYAIPDRIMGVYGFWYQKTGECLYVGRSLSIKRRLRQHRNNCTNPILRTWLEGAPESVEICILEVKGGKMRINKVERRLIKKWRPEANVVYNRKKE